LKGEKMNKYYGNLSEPSFKGKKPKRDEKPKQPKAKSGEKVRYGGKS
jgi:hypothetical protein